MAFANAIQRRLYHWKPAPYVVVSSIVSIGGLLFGLDTGTIGPITAMPSFKRTFGDFSSTIHGLIVSSILIPAALASFFAGHLADNLGRPKAVTLGAGIFGLGTGIEAASVNIGMLLLGRSLTGVGEGLFLSTLVVNIKFSLKMVQTWTYARVSPLYASILLVSYLCWNILYVCEISPPRQRGPLTAIQQFLISVGVCVGYFICYGTVNIHSSVSWRIPFAFQSVIAFTYAILSALFIPPSPRWLVQVGRGVEAGAIWDKLGVSSTEREKDDETRQQDERAMAEGLPAPSSPSSWRDRFEVLGRVFKKDVRSRTLLIVFMMGMQQLSGIDGVLYYAPLLFQQAGLSTAQSSFLASGVSGLLMMLITIPAFLLSDRWGRRTSAIIGGSILATCMLIIGSLYASKSVHPSHGGGRWVVVASIFIFALAFCGTWAVSFRIYSSEVHPASTRAAATSLGQSSNWIINWIVAFTTPIFLAHSTFGAYFLFGGASLLTVIICSIFMRETRGRTLEVIDESFRNGESLAGPKKALRKLKNLRSRNSVKLESLDEPNGTALVGCGALQADGAITSGGR